MQLSLPRSQLTVDELNFYIQGLFTSDASLKSLVVFGEISELKRHTSGHCYFTLLGDESRVACALFKQYAGFVPRWPKNGDKVLAEGSVGVYPQRGVYQLYARRLIPAGIGAIERSRQELKERLEKEGVFAPELKRSLPLYPARVALITSATSAAVWDVIKVARRRYPACSIIVVGTQVQGADAPDEIVRAISRVSLIPNLDCVIIARGGGSREDLVPFDDERVVRAVRSCPVPVVSGVGHDVDASLCDLAADVRASTPSAAAEIVFPNQADILLQLEGVAEHMKSCVSDRIADSRLRLSYAASSLLRGAQRKITDGSTSLDAAYGRLRSAMDMHIMEAGGALAVRAASLDALSPLSALSRGFAVCETGGERVTSARVLHRGEHVDVRFIDGRAGVVVEIVEN
ncbi:exodeoxyribonuclease 7 large subunit [Synergistales bacterium]|nr:exodeoxyribonuclease 7 large subunit [Synergistales bacterium]